MKLSDMKHVELLGLTLDRNLDCSPKKSVVIEISLWLLQAFFPPLVSCSPFPVCCFASSIAYINICIFISQSRFFLCQNEGVLCENE